MDKKDSMSLKRTDPKGKSIVITGKFKTCNLYNNTLHIILYPDDGLRTAANLQNIDECVDVTLNLEKNS